MTMGFDEWYRKAGYLGDDQNTRAKIAFEAGAASRQDEIDELKWLLKNANGQADDFCKESIELQKRIDEALYKLQWLNWKNIDGKMKGEIMDILKGKKDE